MDKMNSVYSGPSYSSGYPVFVGGRRQVGGGIFGALKRSILPAIKPYAKAMLKRAGKHALNFGSNVVGDALQGENLKNSIKMRAKESAINALDDLSKSRRIVRRRRRKSRQVGSGRVTKQKRRRKVQRRRRSSVRKVVGSRKRRRKSIAGGNKQKRRKITYI